MKKIICVIPARIASQRFPRKILSSLGDKTLLQHVWEAANLCPEFDSVYFAIDNIETAAHLESFNAPYCMTSPEAQNGTHRIIEFLQNSGISADVIVNWQADEPFIHKAMIHDLLQGVETEGDIWSLKKEAKPEELTSPHTVKVVCDNKNRALYFSRSLIPFDRTNSKPQTYKHIGLYAYTQTALKIIETLPMTPLAQAESLEQLQFLENGLSLYVYPTLYETQGIDTPEDLLQASQLLQKL